jgi:hypothetical protein
MLPPLRGNLFWAVSKINYLHVNLTPIPHANLTNNQGRYIIPIRRSQHLAKDAVIASSSLAA